MPVSFNHDDLKDKVSDLSLGDIIEMGDTVDDYNVDLSKHDLDEFRKPIRVRFDAELTNATSYLLNKFDCSSNILMKSATKLGAMLIGDKLKTLEDIYWFLVDVVYKFAQLKSDVSTIHLVNTYTESIMDTVSRFRPKYPKFTKDKSIYPYPKWRKVLDSYSWITRLPKSEIYRGAIAMAYSTEITIISSQEFNNWVNIVASEILNTTQKFCVVFKNSTGFIKLGYEDYIKQRINNKENLSDSVREIIRDVLLND